MIFKRKNIEIEECINEFVQDIREEQDEFLEWIHKTNVINFDDIDI